MVISLNTVITTIVGIIISVLTGYLSLKVRQLDEKNLTYRKEREQKEKAEITRREAEESAQRELCLGMARSMLLQNYYKAASSGVYPVEDREVYHELFRAYEEAGGDGILHSLAEKIVQLPTELPKDLK